MVFLCKAEFPPSLSRNLLPYTVQPDQKGPPADDRADPPKAGQSFPEPSSHYFVVDSFPLWSVSLGGHGTAVPSVQRVPIMVSALPKKKLILVSGFMPWLPWRAMPQLLKSPRPQWMTGRGRDLAQNHLGLIIL